MKSAKSGETHLRPISLVTSCNCLCRKYALDPLVITCTGPDYYRHLCLMDAFPSLTAATGNCLLLHQRTGWPFIKISSIYYTDCPHTYTRLFTVRQN